MGTCNSVEVLETNLISTQTFRGKGKLTIAKTYEIPETNKVIGNKVVYVKIVNGVIKQSSSNLDDISEEDSEKDYAVIARSFADGQK